MGMLLRVSIVALENLTQKLASLSQQSSSVQIARTFTAPDDRGIKSFLLSRSTYTPASAVLTQFSKANDPAVDIPKDQSGSVTGHLVRWRLVADTAEKTPILKKVVLAKNNPQPPQMAEERDIVESYANVVKPVDFHQFRNAVKQRGVFWTLVNEAPPDGATVG